MMENYTPLTDAISVLVCLDADRRGVEPNAKAMADRDRVMRRIDPLDGLAVHNFLRWALNILEDDTQ